MPQHYTYGKIVYTPVMLDVITATTTSGVQQCAGARSVGIEFTEGGSVLNRSGVLTITVSMDGGTTFRTFNMLIDNLVNANNENLTRVASKTRASAGTDILWLDSLIVGAITHFKATVTITDGATPTGNFTVKTVICY